jgi:hypothetical protein
LVTFDDDGLQIGLTISVVYQHVLNVLHYLHLLRLLHSLLLNEVLDHLIICFDHLHVLLRLWVENDLGL